MEIIETSPDNRSIVAATSVYPEQPFAEANSIAGIALCFSAAAFLGAVAYTTVTKAKREAESQKAREEREAATVKAREEREKELHAYQLVRAKAGKAVPA